MRLKRINFLTAAGISLIATGTGKADESLSPAAGLSQKKPNILWIMTDQQCANSMSCAGNTGLSTPAMDSIARDGVRMELAYCTQPICVPSRTSMMTGKMPHETGVTFNLNRMDILDRSIGNVMTEAGYDTGYVGKWHIPMEAGTNKWHGFGFMIEGTKNFNDQYVAEPIIEFITRERTKPFFAVASFNNPHDICEWARMAGGGPGLRTTTWNGPIPPAPPADQCPPLPANFAISAHEPQVIREHQRTDSETYPAADWADDDPRWRQYRWALNRLTERVDMEIGKILTALRTAGLEENTLIIFVSDHGDGNAAHHWNQKNLLYEETARVPFIIAGPGITIPGRVDHEHLVSTGLDIFPTVCDYAGIPAHEGLQGISLRPLMEGRPGDTHESIVVETDLHRRYGQSGGVYGRMLRTQTHKYIAYSKGKNREQLFDLRTDPGEMNNLAVLPEYKPLLQKMRKNLAEQLDKTNDFFEVPEVGKDGWTLTAGTVD